MDPVAAVLFAAGISLCVVLPAEPEVRVAAAFVLRALGVFWFARGSLFGLASGIALLALYFGCGGAKLRTELALAPVLKDELRHVPLHGYAETFERRKDARSRLTLRVLSIGSLVPGETLKRIRVSISGKKTNVLFFSEAVEGTSANQAIPPRSAQMRGDRESKKPGR